MGNLEIGKILYGSKSQEAEAPSQALLIPRPWSHDRRWLRSETIADWIGRLEVNQGNMTTLMLKFR